MSSGGSQRPSGLPSKWLARLPAFQAERPWLPIAVAAVLTLLAGLLASGLTLRTGFDSLLPDRRPSVVELRRVSAHISGVSSLFVVLEGGPSAKPEAMRAAADSLVEGIARIGPPWVGSVEDGVHEAERFLAPRAGLFATVERLERLRDEVREHHQRALAEALDTLVDDEPLPPLTKERVREILGARQSELDKFPGGYYQSADGRTLVVAVQSKVPGGEFTQGVEAMRRIREAVERVDLAGFDPGIRWGFAGDLASGVAEYSAVRKDLTDVGLLGAVLIAAVVFLYYLRLRTLLAMLVTIGVGVTLTFGLTRLAIGHLNVATGFLFTIVAGNGINFAILYMARYLEERQRGAGVGAAIAAAHRDTWSPTLTAACAAAGAYGSLAVTEFRGFRDFGFIGAAGMLVCWAATYWTLPALLALLERARPTRVRASGAAHGGLSFGAPFAAVVSRWPRAVAVGGMAVALVGAIATATYASSDPMEYDLTKMRTDVSARAEEVRLNRVADSVTGFVGLDAMAILVDRPEQVEPLERALEARRDAAPAGAKPFGAVFSLQDFVPADQPAKIAILDELRQLALRGRARGVFDAAAWSELEPYLPPANLSPFGIADLPASIARSFTENNGTRGRIVYLSPIGPGAVDDARYLFRWADSYRETPLPDGSVVRGSGRAVIYADLWAAVLADVPRAVLASLAATVLVVAVAFAGGSGALLVLGALLAGVAWMGAALGLAGVRLNFLNFIALPITFGIGVDYAVNLVQRYRQEGRGGALRAVRATGGAVVLCSLTTVLGYLSLLRSTNPGIRSLGLAAALGEACCLSAAMLVLPAALVWRDGNRPAAMAVLPARGATHG